MTGRVLVIDDDPTILRTLRINLRARAFDVETVTNGRDALNAVRDSPPDVVVLDLGLPDVDGLEVLRRIRRSSRVPVVVLSARHESDDKVEALDEGADDYVTKPFGMDELMARVRAALRRGGEGLPSVPPFHCDDFALDFDDRVCTVGGDPVHLTPTEWRLLAELSRHDGRIVPHETLLKAAWGPSYGRESNYLRVYANQLRRKVEPDPGHPVHLLTEPGVGYRLVP
ncbi:MAG: response regulator transcription factor [Tetrasphaera sp.]|jgi:two-component system KDP operon response regulator KdpE|nr:response regulator transcription factor [Tetrasphaera sp.]